MKPLSPRQQDCLAFLSTFREQHGVMPTIREIARGMGLRSTTHVKAMLDALEDRGRIRRPVLAVRRGRRAIELIGATVCCPQCSHKFSPGRS